MEAKQIFVDVCFLREIENLSSLLLLLFDSTSCDSKEELKQQSLQKNVQGYPDQGDETLSTVYMYLRE